MPRPVDVNKLIHKKDLQAGRGLIGKIRKRDNGDAFLEETNEATNEEVFVSKRVKQLKHTDTEDSDGLENDTDDLQSLAKKSIQLLKNVSDVNGGGTSNADSDRYLGKHWSQKRFEEMTARDWRIMCEDFDISSKGGSVEKPLRNWHELDLIPKDLLDIITNKLHYKEPTPIQRSALPNVVHKQRDFIGVASTGSGKTLSFLLPILIKLSNRAPLNTITKMDGPLALVLAPTRELAQQIQREGSAITKLWRRPCKIVSLVGGHSLEEISLDLRDGCDILVATPGRLIDSLESRIVFLKQLEILVLDEADKMIDFGFEEQLTTILAKTDSLPNRQTMMFTATFSSTIEKVASGYLRKPSYVTIGGNETHPKIKHIVDYVVEEEERLGVVTRKYLNHYKGPIIIFINYKKTADWLLDKLKAGNFRATTLHGSKSQDQREHSLDLLRKGKVDILIATDVAGRGIDIPNVSLVINFQFPKNFDSFVHRVGRTGRAGKEGTALTFLGDSEDPSNMNELFKMINNSKEPKDNIISKKAKQIYNNDKAAYNPILI